ncbi:hypothetical protein ACJCF0_004465 [Enterobacter hormaechei]|nr:hypothetical protein [Escherichia coli]HAW0473443.1 hypothetical protein [Escherichia coli]HDQ1474545.1 hypothetical protein [Escherichia coli]
MITEIELDDGFLPDTISEVIKKNVIHSLNEIKTINDKFIINDSSFMRKQSNNRITPCVMNSASFISSKFQNNLSLLPNCLGENSLNQQRIDGLIKVEYNGFAYRIKDKNKILEVAFKYIESKKLPNNVIYTLFPMFYGMYVDRLCFSIPELNDIEHLFDIEKVNYHYKIGIEFETGNVASSFRAINKLNNLFHDGHIDGGCFITSIDKRNSATRIWPVSNRNGSFQELKNRAYISQISLPLICIGFAPDEFSQTAPFLGANGELYELENTYRRDLETNFEIFTKKDGLEFLKAPFK